MNEIFRENLKRLINLNIIILSVLIDVEYTVYKFLIDLQGDW
jgi:hypothetical protein